MSWQVGSISIIRMNWMEGTGVLTCSCFATQYPHADSAWIRTVRSKAWPV